MLNICVDDSWLYLIYWRILINKIYLQWVCINEQYHNRTIAHYNQYYSHLNVTLLLEIGHNLVIVLINVFQNCLVLFEAVWYFPSVFVSLVQISLLHMSRHQWWSGCLWLFWHFNHHTISIRRARRGSTTQTILSPCSYHIGHCISVSFFIRLIDPWFP